MKIRTKDLPDDRKNVEGFDLRRFEPDHVYDVSPRLAELLIVMAYAEPEMRRRPSDRDTADDRPRRRRTD